MGHPDIDDLVTVEELATRLKSPARARRMLKEAGIPVFAGCFSGSALKAALGGQAPSEAGTTAPSPADEHERIAQLLGTSGLVLRGLVKRRRGSEGQELER